MVLTIIYIILAFALGFGVAWYIGTNNLQKESRELKSARGFLESERLVKETLQKELALVHRNKMAIELDLNQKLDTANKQMQLMDNDIILMQKHYEETEALLKAKQPEIHALKIQQIELQNTIARLKSSFAAREKV